MCVTSSKGLPETQATTRASRHTLQARLEVRPCQRPVKKGSALVQGPLALNLIVADIASSLTDIERLTDATQQIETGKRSNKGPAYLAFAMRFV